MKILNVTLLIVLLAMIGCTEDGTTTQNQIESNVIADTWYISFYSDDGKNETSDFSGYNFTFQSNGVLSATNSSTTVTGTWSISDSNSGDDELNDLDFNISFSNPSNNFDDLIDDWEILSQTSTKIELSDTSNGNGGIDLLTFTKN